MMAAAQKKILETSRTSVRSTSPSATTPVQCGKALIAQSSVIEKTPIGAPTTRPAWEGEGGRAARRTMMS
ncbi:hypothetical protein GSI_04076 [Ganoderma sinense ZZ0214-1]|uniref:Uncharacterized protein n=1 Tax=Ganoderma sinense ZZ0214-1 TaxID=1077348 RepID=A0A2G8SI69_9APHY|nr:hypothetical protein GSI_04076 [Ganoderma sinense ZZ0214-1]